MTKRLSLLVMLVALTQVANAQWSGTDPLTTNSKVGIGGVPSPVNSLEIAGSTINSSGKFGSFEIQGYAINNAWLGENVYYNGGFIRRGTGAGTLLYFFNGTYAVRTFSAGAGGSAVSPTQRFLVLTDGTTALGGSQTSGTVTGAAVVIDANGNMGVGTTAPGYKIDVSGTAHVSGDVTIDGNIAAKYQDVAEWVPAAENMTPGTVVIVDRSGNNRVATSTKPYDELVAGVVSAQPGLILGEKRADREQIATTGRVRVKVEGPVNIGDLLVTGNRPGHAMRSEKISVGGIEIHRPGTILGKALEASKGGEGEVLVLLGLQ